MLSASDFLQCLGRGKFGTAREIIQKKVEPFVEHGPTTNPFFIHGIKFEQVASDIYAKMHNVKLYEFGIIQHPKYDWAGCSPDGIREDGIMLEIKAPLKRRIKPGDPVPEQYFYQVQGQLDVCGLTQCDYFECEFVECKTVSQWEFSIQTKGVFITNPDGTYEYGPLILEDQYNQKDKKILGEYIHKNKSRAITYWCLNTYNLVRVEHDPVFMEKTIEQLREVWNKILFYRENHDAYITEVVQAISIETEKYNKTVFIEEKETTETKFSGYAFLD